MFPQRSLCLEFRSIPDCGEPDSAGNVSSEAYGMDTAAYIVSENGATASWDETTGQDYAEFTDAEGNFCQIWLENELPWKKR